MKDIQYRAFDTAVAETVESLRVTMGYRRCIDFDKADEEGQDFATIRADEAGYSVGVVADGVSQSFMGNLAAAELSRLLLDVLWASRSLPPTGIELDSLLREWERELGQLISEFPLPTSVEPWIVPHMEDARRDGSQAVFAAFVLDARARRAHLFQVGDVTALVCQSHDGVDLTEQLKSKPVGRFSSTGDTEHFLSARILNGVRGLLLKSDGAGSWGNSFNHPLDQGSFAYLAADLSQKDDVSFVSARIERLSNEALVGPFSEDEGSGMNIVSPVGNHVVSSSQRSTPHARQSASWATFQREPEVALTAQGRSRSSFFSAVGSFQTSVTRRIDGSPFTFGLLIGVAMSLSIGIGVRWAFQHSTGSATLRGQTAEVPVLPRKPTPQPPLNSLGSHVARNGVSKTPATNPKKGRNGAASVGDSTSRQPDENAKPAIQDSDTGQGVQTSATRAQTTKSGTRKTDTSQTKRDSIVPGKALQSEKQDSAKHVSDSVRHH